jgi:CxxC motif-containing protein (DUF1111 family)
MRTPPLWGVRPLQKANGTPFYLHDARARTLDEAIRWHGGKVSQAKLKIVQHSSAARNELIQFLKSL